ncbi:MAG: helix-turn-helix domain-containing protein, partial [Candidatus Heimdallarchaeota archaeon]
EQSLQRRIIMNESKKRRDELIIGAQLYKARETLQLSVKEIAQELNIAPEEILNWEGGLSKPSLKQLENLSQFYGREVDYFLKETPDPPEKVKFRSVTQQSLKHLSKEARIVIAKFDELCRAAFEFENLLGEKLELKISQLSKFIPPQSLAQELRQRFRLEDKPIRKLRNLLEEEGIRIFELPVPDNRFSGFSNWHPDYGPCILINSKEAWGRRNFTLAHEYAHLLYGHEPSVCEISLTTIQTSNVKVEQIANQFAVELLLPESGVRIDFRQYNLSRRPTERELGQMAGKWRVSIQALGYRLENLNLIEKGLINSLWEGKPRHFRRSAMPTWERRLGKKFVEMALKAYYSDKISIGKLSHSFGIPIRKAIEKVAQQSK